MSIINDIKLVLGGSSKQKPALDTTEPIASPPPLPGGSNKGNSEVEAPGVPRKSPNDRLLRINKGNDLWTIGNAFEGTQIFGATGSGKTSGSGQHIAVSMLKAGFGGLVLTVKTDECELWKKYAKLAGREPPIVFGVPSAEHPYRFNFLEYERKANEASSDGNSLTDNLVSLFSAVIEVSSRSSGSQGNQDAYWKQTLKQLLRNAIDMLVYAGERLSFRAIYDVVTSALPQLQPRASKEYAAWLEESFCGKCIKVLESTDDVDPAFQDIALVHTYWTREYPCLAPETRSIIVSYFTSMADPFLRGILRELFSSTSGDMQLNPELTHEGRVIIIDLPVKQFNELGQFAQTLYKFIWQRAAERRDVKGGNARPIFLWVDEAQFFVNSNDMLFMTTARSKHVAAVYLTQNISNYYAIMPGDKGKAETDALLGNFNTKIFHANGDSVTNQWASELIGKTLVSRQSRSASVSSQEHQQASSNFSSSERDEMDYQVLPVRFTTLKKGGPDNNLEVSGFIFQTGRVWSSGRNYMELSFTQQELPES